MKILLLGGTGLVGKYLAGRLLKLGYRIDLLTRSPNQIAPASSLIVPIEADLSESDWIDRAKLDLDSYDIVYHLAYATIEDESYNRVVTVESVKTLLTWLQHEEPSRLKHFIYVGSMSVYGMHPKDAVVNENSEKVADTSYARNKIDATTLVTSTEAHFLTTVLHPTGVYDATSSRITTYRKLLRSGYIVPSMGGNGVNNIVHAEDLASALIFCLQRTSGVKAEEYIINGESLPYREWFSMLERATGVQNKPRISPRRMWSRRSILGRILMKCGYRVPIFMPEYKMALYENKAVFSSEKAKTHFSFMPQKSFRTVCEEIASHTK